MAANFASIIRQLEIKLARQEEATRATREHIEAIKALQKIEKGEGKKQ